MISRVKGIDLPIKWQPEDILERKFEIFLYFDYSSGYMTMHSSNIIELFNIKLEFYCL